MGTDIRWQVEFFYENEWRWFKPQSHYERFVYSWRNSVLYDILAGAGKKQVPPAFPVRGVPKDLSIRLEIEHKLTGILGTRDFSWLTYGELCNEEIWDKRLPSGSLYRDHARDLLWTVLPCMEQLLVDIPYKLHGNRKKNIEPLSEHNLRAVFGFID